MRGLIRTALWSMRPYEYGQFNEPLIHLIFKALYLFRWVKYEENLEEGGKRWSKPHVASLSMHSLFELRCAFVEGNVTLDHDAYSMANACGKF